MVRFTSFILLIGRRFARLLIVVVWVLEVSPCLIKLCWVNGYGGLLPIEIVCGRRSLRKNMEPLRGSGALLLLMGLMGLVSGSILARGGRLSDRILGWWWGMGDGRGFGMMRGVGVDR
jgi:hypothetical protein